MRPEPQLYNLCLYNESKAWRALRGLLESLHIALDGRLAMYGQLRDAKLQKNDLVHCGARMRPEMQAYDITARQDELRPASGTASERHRKSKAHAMLIMAV